MERVLVRYSRFSRNQALYDLYEWFQGALEAFCRAYSRARWNLKTLFDVTSVFKRPQAFTTKWY